MAELYLFISVFLVNAPQGFVTGSRENNVVGVCTQGYFQCENDTVCISQQSNCDGKIDCPNGSDEINCDDLDEEHFWDHFVKKRPAALNDDIKICNLSYNGSCVCRGRDLLCSYKNLTKIPEDLPKENINLLDLELNNFRVLSEEFVKAVPENVDKIKFVVHTCLLIFIALFAIRLDNYVTWSFWCVFAPIWVWKVLVILGATVGSYVWWRYPHFRLDCEAYIHYKSMLISLALHLILLMFELLVCDKLESNRHLWILVFIPLIFISIVSIAVCIWAVKHDRSFELELFCAVNVLQFIFLALRLDGFISWSWEVVFVPLWIVMCLSLVGVLYTIIFAAILLRTPEVNAQQRRSSFKSALGYTFLVIPILIFQVLLANKLDGEIRLSYTAVVSPLFISFVTLILMSFSAKGGNRWWFGMRKDFCAFVLGACPLLQEYANIAYHSERRTNGVELQQQNEKSDPTNVKKADLLKPVLPIISIEMPD